MKKKSWNRLVAGAAVAMAAAGMLTACSSTGSGGKETFTIQQYETPGTPEYEGWKEAVSIFEKAHPNVNVKFVTTSFNNMEQNGKLILSGKNVPDVLEVNKGNADAGQYASQGLIENLDSEVKKYGWDKKVTGAMTDLARYDSSGNAGSGDWYGVPNIGEVAIFYYNKKMFADAGIHSAPTSIAAFEQDMQTFEGKGITPISSGAGTSTWGGLWTWYSLVSAYASRSQIDDYMFLKGNPDLTSGAWQKGAEQFQDWIDKGYLGSQIAAVTGEQMDQAWLSQKSPIILEDSGQFPVFKQEAKFDFGMFTMPAANMVVGSSGHLWAVPTKSADKQLAYDWINTTLSTKVQDTIAKDGGLALDADTSAISDPETKDLIQQFQPVVSGNKFAFYPDYPVPGLLNFLASSMQAMVNKSESAGTFGAAFQKYYDSGKQQVTGK